MRMLAANQDDVAAQNESIQAFFCHSEKNEKIFQEFLDYSGNWYY